MYVNMYVYRCCSSRNRSPPSTARVRKSKFTYMYTLHAACLCPNKFTFTYTCGQVFRNVKWHVTSARFKAAAQCHETWLSRYFVAYLLISSVSAHTWSHVVPQHTCHEAVPWSSSLPSSVAASAVSPTSFINANLWHKPSYAPWIATGNRIEHSAHV
jgi:hypothetical protein